MSHSAPAPQPSDLETLDHALAADVKHRLGFQLFQHLPASVAVIDTNFRLVLANGRFASTFGARAGQFCYEVYKKRSEPCTHCPARDTFRDGQVRVMEEHGVDRDGKPTDYVVHVAPLYDDVGNIAYVAEMSNDITEMKTLREEFGILFEQVPCSVAILDSELRIVRANRHLTETFGDATDRHCYEVYKHRTDQCPDCPVLETFRDGEPHHFRQIGLTPDGALKRCLMSAVPLRRNGGSFEHVLEITLDVTEKHDLHRQLVQLEAEKLAQERLVTVGEAVAEIAHGIKNILTGLQGGLHKVRKGQRQNSEEQLTRGWDMIDRNFDRVSRLVKGLLNLSREHEPQLEPTDLTALIRDACLQFQQHAQKAGVTLRCPDPCAPLSAQVDSEDLATCLANLVSNAIDASEGRDHIAGEVTVSLQQRGETVWIDVADNGCGMDEQEQRRACDLFYSTKGPKGTGLGLAVTRKLIAGHGGRLEIESERDHGSVFRLVLPASPTSTQHKEEQHE